MFGSRLTGNILRNASSAESSKITLEKISHELRTNSYKVGDKVRVRTKHNRKYGEDAYIGPFTIDQVHDNGTLKLRQSTQSGGVIYQTWNIHNVLPYKD